MNLIISASIFEALGKAAQYLYGGDLPQAMKATENALQMEQQALAMGGQTPPTGRGRTRASGGTAATAGENVTTGVERGNAPGDEWRLIYNKLAQRQEGLTNNELLAQIGEIKPDLKIHQLTAQLKRWAGTGSVRVEGDRFIATGKIPEPSRQRGRPRRAAA